MTTPADAQAPAEGGLRWRDVLAVAAVVVPCALVLSLWLKYLSFFLLSLFLFGPAVLFAGGFSLVAAILHRGAQGTLPLLALAAVFWGVVPLTFCVGVRIGPVVTNQVAWWWSGEGYRQAVLAQPAGTARIRHVEWDGWSFAGMETVVYLAFDPGDGLASQVDAHVYRDIPCPIFSVQRMEQHWFVVTMYADTGWDQCDETAPQPGATGAAPGWTGTRRQAIRA